MRGASAVSPPLPLQYCLCNVAANKSLRLRMTEDEAKAYVSGRVTPKAFALLEQAEAMLEAVAPPT